MRGHSLRDAGNQMSTIQASPEERITAAVRRLLADRGITRSFTAQEDLREVGLTSLDTVNLVLAVEAELAVGIPEAEITPANFRSVATIEALVTQPRVTSQPPDFFGARSAISVISFLRIASANVS